MSSVGINKVILIGYLGKDPDIRMMQNGREMASFSLATSDSWLDKSSGVRTEKTEWHNVVVFSDGLVKVVKACARKGSRVYIEGSLRTRKWVDQNNNDRYVTEVVLQGYNSSLYLLDPKGMGATPALSSDGESDTGLGSGPSAGSEVCDDLDFLDSEIDEIPF
ncbi:MAG: single-stranded DNA-binding protein [Aaplasma endosymbiont of Hyalomma asiaticum]